MDLFQEVKKEFKPQEFFENTQKLLNKNFSGFPLDIVIKTRHMPDLVFGDMKRVEWMLNKLVKNSIHRTFNSRKKKIDVRMYCADWEFLNSDQASEVASLQTEKNFSHYMVFEVIDFGDPKLSKRCIKDIFKPPTT